MTSELQWLSALEPFVKEDLITDVLYMVKSGKEAVVYCCAAQPATGHELLAAKIYRSREHRTFSRDTLYQQGRNNNPTFRRAIAARNNVGLAAQFASWIEHEYATLNRLYRAGAAVPQPIRQIGNALLMSYVGDRERAAPPLYRVALQRHEARPLFDHVIHLIELMLRHDFVHGDLSPYNILYWAGAITIIDFPQSVHPQVNPHAAELLQRDVTNVCEYWARYGVRANPRRIAEDMLVRYQFGEL